jgi:hypothetical protein
MLRANSTSPSPRRRRSLLLVIAAAIFLLTVGVATATATSSIEGVWSFDGGQIAVEPEGNGDFKGTVVQPTTFAICTHPVGEAIWTKMAPQPDGSFEGLHQWFKEGENCVVNKEFLGYAAWRVLEAPNGAKSLLVCLSHPGTTQPTIPPGSQGVGATYEFEPGKKACLESAMTAPLAGSAVGSFKQVVSTQCASGRKFEIHINDPKYDPFKTVVVTLRGHKLKVAHHGSVYTATVSLKGLPAGAFSVKIAATTVRGHHLDGRRTYHTCAKKPKKSKPKKLT